MSEMVERVAKAILETMDLTDGLDGTAAENYARAAIEAMREPTEAMFCAGDERIIEALNDHTRILRHVTPAQDAWQAMIDEALK